MMTDFVPSYRREDYPRILKIMEDGGMMPQTWALWEKGAERSTSQAKAWGTRTYYHKEETDRFKQVLLDPDTFIAFCEKNKIPRDARARALFARERGLAREHEEHVSRAVAWEERAVKLAALA